jgi:hypothetical protein
MTRKPAWLHTFRTVSAQGPAWMRCAEPARGAQAPRPRRAHREDACAGSDYAVGPSGRVESVASPKTPLRRLQILVCAQNEWYTEPIPRSCQARGGVDSVITIGGSAFLSVGTRKTPNLDAFLRKTASDVERQIQNFLDRHRTVSERTTAIVIMDIERPHPRDFHLHPTRVQNRLIAAFATRAAAARVKFPKAKLGFYGTLVPDGRGRAQDRTYKARKDALVRAGERGMFDLVDCLIPVAYPRFGPTDRAWDTYEAYTRLAITGSRELAKSDGATLPVVPLLTYSVANGKSAHHEQLLLDLPTPDPLKATLGVQMDVMVAEHVRTAVFWVGQNSDLIARLPNPNGRTVTQHVCSRRPPKVPALPA